MTKFRRFLELPAPERKAALHALGLLWVIRLGLLFIPFRVIHIRCSQALASAKPGYLKALAPERIARLIAVASPFVPGAHCLPRALVGQVMLAQAGHRSDLRIGVRKTGEKLDAHAWLELAGVPLFENDDHLNSFVPFGSSVTSRRLQGK
jgi:hypothetical protein